MTATQTHSQQKPAIPLPDPDTLPEADVVIYDGKCRFCRGGVERIARWDGKHRLAYISLHDPRVAERYPDLTHEQLMAQMYVIDRQGRRHGGAAAARHLSRRLPALWWLAPLLHIPFTMPLWQWMYKQVAKRRYLIAGKEGDDACDEDGTCKLHFD